MIEKKSITMNLNKYVLIVVLVLIIILSLIAYILIHRENLTKETNINANSDVTFQYSDTNQILENNNEYNTSISSDILSENNEVEFMQLPQLAGNFFGIDAIIKESREIRNVKNYKDFEFDLDSDGQVDKITLKHIVNENEEIYSSERDFYTLEYNGINIYERWMGGLGQVGIVDLDNTDKFLEIWIYDDGPSDDPCYYFYRKVGNQIIKMGEFDVDVSFMTDKKGKVVSAGRNIPLVEPCIYNYYYTIENNVFVEHTLDFSNNPNFEYTSEQLFFTTDLNNLKDFEEDTTITDGDTDARIVLGEKYGIKKLDEGIKFNIIEFVTSKNEYAPYDLKIVLKDGTSGYLIHPYGRFCIYD